MSAKPKAHNQHLLRRAGWWYYRRKLLGHTTPVVAALGVRDLDAARALRDHYDAVAELEMARLRAGLSPLPENESLLGTLGLLEKRREWASLAKVFIAYAEYARVEGLAPRTVQNVKTSMLLVARTAGLVAAEAISTREIDESVAQRYAAAVMGARRTPLDVNRGMMTVERTLAQARSLFGERARHSAAYAALLLPPEVARFVDWDSPRPDYVPEARITIETKAKLRRFRQLCRRFAPRAWLALVLLRDLGFRAGEVLQARWDWIAEVPLELGDDAMESGPAAPGPTVFEVSVVISHDYAPKGRSRRFELGPSASEAWRAVVARRLTPEPTIIPGTLAERERLLDRLRECLRALGLDGGDPKVKVLHKLRKQYATVRMASSGLAAAQHELGHADASTTLRSYRLR